MRKMNKRIYNYEVLSMTWTIPYMTSVTPTYFIMLRVWLKGSGELNLS